VQGLTKTDIVGGCTWHSAAGDSAHGGSGAADKNGMPTSGMAQRLHGSSPARAGRGLSAR